MTFFFLSTRNSLHCLYPPPSCRLAQSPSSRMSFLIRPSPSRESLLFFQFFSTSLRFPVGPSFKTKISHYLESKLFTLIMTKVGILPPPPLPPPRPFQNSFSHFAPRPPHSGAFSGTFFTSSATTSLRKSLEFYCTELCILSPFCNLSAPPLFVH